MREDERFVLDSVASSFAGTWEPGEDPPDGYLTISRRTVAVEVSTLTQHVTDHRGTRPRLSDDTAALRLADELDAAMNAAMPSNTRVVLILRAPIIEYRKTKKALAAEIASLVRSKSTLDERIERKIAIQGNEIDISIDSSDVSESRNINAVVMNRYSNPRILKNVIYALENRIAVKAEKCRALISKGPIWLALLNDYFLTDADTYRHGLQFISAEHPFEQILLISQQGSVEALI